MIKQNIDKKIDDLSRYIQSNVNMEEFFVVKITLFLLGIQVFTRKSISESINMVDTYEKLMSLNIDKKLLEEASILDTQMLQHLISMQKQDKEYMNKCVFEKLLLIKKVIKKMEEDI